MTILYYILYFSDTFVWTVSGLWYGDTEVCSNAVAATPDSRRNVRLAARAEHAVMNESSAYGSTRK